MSLADTAGGGIWNAFTGGQQQAQQQGLANLQQVGALQGILAKVREQQQTVAFRDALSKAKTPEEQAQVAAQFGGPKEILAHADRVSGQKATQEMAMARLQSAAQNFQQNFQLRMGAAKTAEERLALQQQAEAFKQQLQGEAQRIAGAKANYDFGFMPSAPPSPTVTQPGSALSPANFTGTPEERAASAQLPPLAQGGGSVQVQQPQAQTPVAPPTTAPAPQPVLSPNATPAPIAPTSPVMPPEIARMPKKYRDQWMAKQSAGEVGKLSPEALAPMAWEKLLFGTNPPGMGNASAAQRAQVNEQRAHLGKSLGLSDVEIAMLPQDNKVKMKAVDKLTTWGAFVDKAADQLLPSIDLAISYAGKMDQSTLQSLNKAIIAGRTEFNDPAANAYAVAVNTVRREYGRLMSGPTSNAMLPVEAMKGADNLISTALDIPAWNEVKNVILKDASFTKGAVQKQIESLRGTIRVPGAPAESAPVTAPTGKVRKWNPATQQIE